MYISVETLKTLKNYAVMLRLVSVIYILDELLGSYLQC